MPCYKLVFCYCLMILIFCFFVALTSSTIDVGSNQALKPLVKLIPNLLAVSRAPSTLKGYHAHFQKWKAWAARFPQVIFFPALELHVALYLISLIQSGYSFTTISLAYYSISFFHKSCAVRNPCDSSFVKAVLEGCKRFFSQISFYYKEASDPA